MAESPPVPRSIRPDIRLLPPRRRRHTPHFYLAVTGITSAALVCVLNLWAYYDEGTVLTEIGFAAVAVTAGVLFFTWFWGMYLLMSGTIAVRRFGYLLLHATLGSISPLLFTIVIGLQMDTVGTQPVDTVEVVLEISSLLILLLQLTIGRRMLRPRHR